MADIRNFGVFLLTTPNRAVLDQRSGGAIFS